MTSSTNGSEAERLRQRVAAAGLDWIVAAWDAPPGVGALATTRNGGPAGDDHDLGPARLDALDADAHAHVLASRARLDALLPAPALYAEQIHGCDVAVIDAATLDAARAHPPVADALVTRLPRVPLAIRVADCLPVLFAARSGAVVAAAHAGWRGLAAGVLEATVAALATPPEDVVAWLGPCIGPAAFEVGDDVRDAFGLTHAGDTRHFQALRPGKWLADLPALARARLARLGVSATGVAGACTHADAARFHSWRRDRSSRRLAACVWRV